MSALPKFPYDGQVFVDGNSVKWQWSAPLDVWVRIGTANTIPLATSTTPGLLSPQLKHLLDSVSPAGGSFGIIVGPQLILKSDANPDGVISGNITLHSESLTITPVAPDGSTLVTGAGIADPSTLSVTNLPGFSLALSRNFLSSLCLEITGPVGPEGQQGPQGAHGLDGFNDGPQGEQGDPGNDATTANVLTGVKVIDLNTVTDTAVVSLQIDGQSGVLAYTTAKMNVPEDDEPADQISPTPIQRSVIYPDVPPFGHDYVTLDDWQLGIPSGDSLAVDPEVLLVNMPSSAQIGDTVDVTTTKLTDYITHVVNFYKQQLANFQTTWFTQMRDYITQTDAAARQALASLAQQVAQCEFSQPLSFCLGIQPSDCTTGTSAATAAAAPPVGHGTNQFTGTELGVTGPAPEDTVLGSVLNTPKSAKLVVAPGAFDPINPVKCTQPYKMAVVMVTDNGGAAYTTGVDDPNVGQVNYYYNDKANWEQMIDGLNTSQAVMLGVLQAPSSGDGFFGDSRDLTCAGCNFPYDSIYPSSYYEALPVRTGQRVLAADIVNFVNNLISAKWCGDKFVPDQINICIESRLFRPSAIVQTGCCEVINPDYTSDVKAFNDAIDELEKSYPNICFVATINSTAIGEIQNDRWLRNALNLVQGYMCYRCPSATVPGHNKIVVLCITSDASPIYTVLNYGGPDGLNGPYGIPFGITPWDFDFNKWEEIVTLLKSGHNKVRLGVLQPNGYAADGPSGLGYIQPVGRSLPGDSDRGQITLLQTNSASVTSSDVIAAYNSITNNGKYSATHLYVIIDTSGTLGDPNVVMAEVEAGVSSLQLQHSKLLAAIDKIDIPLNANKLSYPQDVAGYTIQPAPDAYSWGWEYVPTNGGDSILYPSLYVRGMVDAAKRWLGRAVNVMQQLIYYWMPHDTYAPASPYNMLVIVITDEAYKSNKYTFYDGYRSLGSDIGNAGGLLLTIQPPSPAAIGEPFEMQVIAVNSSSLAADAEVFSDADINANIDLEFNDSVTALIYTEVWRQSVSSQTFFITGGRSFSAPTVVDKTLWFSAGSSAPPGGIMAHPGTYSIMFTSGVASGYVGLLNHMLFENAYGAEYVLGISDIGLIPAASDSFVLFETGSVVSSASVNAVAGIATFTGVTIPTAGTYCVIVSSGTISTSFIMLASESGTTSSLTLISVTPATPPAALTDNQGYNNYKADKAAWNAWLRSLCSDQRVRMGVLQLANPGAPAYPEQAIGGPDPYVLPDGTTVGGWIIDDASSHSFFQDIRDLLPDTSWGIISPAEDGSLPSDSNGIIQAEVLSWNGLGKKRVLGTDIVNFYKQLTNDGAFVPDMIVVAVDNSASMQLHSRYLTGVIDCKDGPPCDVAHDNITHGVQVVGGAAAGPRVKGSVDRIDIPLGFQMIDEIQSAIHEFRKIIPTAGTTGFGYKHPLLYECEFAGRWLSITSILQSLFLNQANDSGYSSPYCADCGTFHVGDARWWAGFRQTVCPTILHTSIPCVGCESP